MRTYETDFAGWAEDTARAVHEGRFEEIDRTALADELEGLSSSERHRLRSALCLLAMHLLKVRYQPEKRSRSWDASIRVQRANVNDFLEESPSLRTRLPELLGKAYAQARIDAAAETGLDIDTFPEACPWTPVELMGC